MAAELFDPFEVVREEVQESVGRAEALAASFADPDDPWRQQGPGHGLTPPPHPTSPATFPLQLRQFKLVLWPLERDKFQVSLTSQSNLGFGSRLPAQLVEYMIKKGAGNMFRKLLDEATALQQAPRRNPYAKMLRREKGYYEHLARRLSRYLSALAD